MSTILVLSEDAERYFLYKPAGLPVFPPHADPGGDCLLARLRDHGLGGGAWPAGFEGGLAHRLDNATSGIVIAAKTPAALAKLREQFSAGILSKNYRFHTSAHADWAERVVTRAIAHHPSRADRMVVQHGERTAHRGKWYAAWTRFTHRGGPWWNAEIHTGVMHQIRVHAQSVGIPLTGDKLYGGGPGDFVLVHEHVSGPGWASPVIPPTWPGSTATS